MGFETKITDNTTGAAVYLKAVPMGFETMRH